MFWKLGFNPREAKSKSQKFSAFKKNGYKYASDLYVNIHTFVLQEILSLLFLPGESVDDCGGGYSESIAEMCDELQNGSLPLLIVTPNGRDESGANRDCFLLNPMIRQHVHQNMFKFLGKYMYSSVGMMCQS